MQITEYQNAFDLQDKTVYRPAPELTFAQWYERHYAGREHLVAFVVMDGAILPQARWGDDLAGSVIYILTKPGDPGTIFTIINTVLAVGSIVYSIINKPNVPRDLEESPAYTLGAQSNQSRLGSPVPVQYGKHRIWPDLLAPPFSTYASNDQYVYQLFCLGAGEFDPEDLYIDDTLASSFSEITAEYYYETPVTLFPTDVASSSETANQKLVESYIGPFVASATGTEARRLDIDIVWEQGLFRARSNGDTDQATTTLIADYQQIDGAGGPIGSWTSFVNEKIRDATRVPKRITRSVTVSPGRYQVRVKRGEVGASGTKMYTDCVWEGLRAFLGDDEKTYDGITVLAVRAKATGNLNSNSSRRFNVVATRKLPIWNGTTWSAPTATRSIAWALADIIRAHYGAARVDSLIDLAKLLTLDSVWSGRGDTFDYRFDVTQTLWEALKIAARAGRAQPIMNNKVISFTRTAPQTIPATIFNRHNLTDFTVDYQLLNEESNDSVLAEYIEPEYNWQTHQVLCQPPGSPGLIPRRVKLLGITDRAQAFREGIYEAEAERRQRKSCKFTTELEGYIPSPGDLICVANEDFKYDQGGEVVSVSGTTLTLSEAVTWTPAVSHAIRLRKPDGSVSGPHAVTEGAQGNQVVLNTPLGWTPSTSGDQVRTLYQFGVVGSILSEFIVKELRPRGGNKVEVIAVIEVDSVHTVDQATVPADIVPGPIASNENGPVIRTLLVENTSNPAVLYVAWSPAPGAQSYVLEYSLDVGATWLPWITTENTFVSLPAPSGDLQIRVAGIGLAKGPWKLWSGTVGNYVVNPPTDLSLTAELALSSSGDYVTNLVFAFAVTADDYHAKAYEAQYKLGRHADWKPLYNALETRWEWQIGEIGQHQVRVRTVYVQGEVYSAWAETTLTNLGTYTSIASIGLNAPGDPKLFISTNIDKTTADIRISASYEKVDGAVPDRFVIFYSAAEAPNAFKVGADTGTRLYLDSVGIAGLFTLPVAAGSSLSRVRFTDTSGIADIDLSGMWWMAIDSVANGFTQYFKVSESSTSELVLPQGEEFPFVPSPGDTIHIAELDFGDSRLAEFKLIWVGDEVVKHSGIKFDSGLDLYYLQVEQRAAEGTTQSDQSGKTAHYFPALGPLTNSVEIMAADFVESDGGQFAYSGAIPVDIPSNMTWSSVSCCLARRATSGESSAYVRSFIVPLTIAGPA